MDSDDDDYHSDAEEYVAAESDDDNGCDYDDADADDGIDADDGRAKQTTFEVLTEDDLRRRQYSEIAATSSLLSVSSDAAFVLLRRQRWVVTNVHEDWLCDSEAAMKAVGLVETNPLANGDADEREENRKVKCGICLSRHRHRDMVGTACGHRFCVNCWKECIRVAVLDGPGCLSLRCPEPSCRAAVGPTHIRSLASDDVETLTRYSAFILRSYVEDSKCRKWCPAADCTHAIEFVAGSDDYGVACACGHRFCWNCMEERHRPVDCATVRRWAAKNKDEAANTEWILAYCKLCPKCRRAIEKNKGCMHMTCRDPCRYEFCWLCLGDWKHHGHNYYQCNTFSSEETSAAHTDAEKRRKDARSAIDRYSHYYERWAANGKSREVAAADLRGEKGANIRKVARGYGLSLADVGMMEEAWRQVVECRRVLRWTYVYGYYLPEGETAKKELFEYLQGEAEAALERLHKCAEEEMMAFVEEGDVEEGMVGRASLPPVQDFRGYFLKICGLTATTRNFFENLVRGLEDGLEDVRPASAAEGSKH